VASLVAGQLAALLGLVLFGGVLLPVLVAFIGSAAGCFVVAEPRRASPTGGRLQLPGPQQPGAPAADHVPALAPYPVAALSVEAALQRAHAASHWQSRE
jgi:hypothetical protein